MLYKMSQYITKQVQPLCIQTTLRIMGDKWTALILRDLTANINTFSRLEVSLLGISPRTLSQRLDMLESEGIINKRQYCERPPRYKYLLTKKGSELQDVLTKMAEWGSRYHDPVATPRYGADG